MGRTSKIAVIISLVVVFLAYRTIVEYRRPNLGISVEILAPGVVSEGEVVFYTIEVENTGNRDLDVTVQDSLGFYWVGAITRGSTEGLEARFEVPPAGQIQNTVEVIGLHGDASVTNSTSLTFEVVPTYSVIEVADTGMALIEFSGTGYCAGESIRLKIEPSVDFTFKLRIEPGTVLINSGRGQNMVIAQGRIITVEPEVEIKLDIEAYCLDVNRANPSVFEDFSVLMGSGEYGEEVFQLMRSL